jgi:hypothetical protein
MVGTVYQTLLGRVLEQSLEGHFGPFEVDVRREVAVEDFVALRCCPDSSTAVHLYFENVPFHFLALAPSVDQLRPYAVAAV